jgi:DNA polymerase III delta subunit
LIVIKLAESLKEDVRKFLAGYARKPLDKVILVLDTNSVDRKDSFFPALARYAKVFRFREPLEPDVFALCRSIDANRTQAALKILNRLLANGEKPEMILGGLRYAWERNSSGIKQARRKLNLLLKCDLEIKTGLLRPAFSLEKLVVGLCAFGDLSG